MMEQCECLAAKLFHTAGTATRRILPQLSVTGPHTHSSWWV